MSDLQQLNRIVDEVAERHPAGFTVDDVVKGGSRRRRRRSLGAVAGGAAAVAAAAVVAGGVIPLPGGDQTAPPAATSTTLPGCTLEPSTCEAAVVDRWADELDGVTIAPGEFVPVEKDNSLQLPAGSVELTGREVKERSDHAGQIGTLDVLVAPEVGGSDLWDITALDHDRPWQEREVEVVPGVTAQVASFDEEGRSYELWTVREGPGHGALAVSYEGSRPEGWSDDELAPLVAALLTE